MSRARPRAPIQSELHLEEAMETHLPELLAPHDLDLLVIGRQVILESGRCVDLLAIDTTGRIWIVELKLGQADPSVVPQVIDYSTELMTKTRDDFIELVRHASGRDLEPLFEAHFGHALPYTVNDNQAMLVIASSFHRRVMVCVDRFSGTHLQLVPFRYVTRGGRLRLIPPTGADRHEPNAIGVPVPLRQKRVSERITAPPPSTPRATRLDIRWFWHLHEPRLVSPIVPLHAIHDLYVKWMEMQKSQGSRFDALWHIPFGRHFLSLIRESAEWERVYLLPDVVIDPFMPLTEIPTFTAGRAAGHRVVAYRRRAEVGRATE